MNAAAAVEAGFGALALFAYLLTGELMVRRRRGPARHPGELW